MKTSRKLIVALTMAAMVLTMLGTGVVSAAAPTVQTTAFSDIGSSDFAKAINYLAALGVVNGLPGGTYNPTGKITREEIAKIIVGFVGQADLANQLSANGVPFKDAAKVQDWAVGYVNAAKALGIIQGYPDGTFRPLANVTAQEALTMIIRALGDECQAAAAGGTWPGSYLSAAAILQISTGVNFAGGLDATRGEVAQFVFNAGTKAHRYQPVFKGNTDQILRCDTANGVQDPIFTANELVKTGTLTAVSGNTVFISGQALPLAGTVTVLGATSLTGAVGSVKYALDPSGNVSLIEKTTTSGAATVTGNLNSDQKAIPSYLTGVTVGSGSSHWWLKDASGNNFILFDDGRLVQLTGPVNGTPGTGNTTRDNAPAAPANPGDWDGDFTVVTLDQTTGLGKTIQVFSGSATGVVSTAPTAAWNTTSGATFKVSVSNTDDTQITLTPQTAVTVNGQTMTAQDAYAKIQSDVKAQVYPVIKVQGSGSPLVATSAQITDTQVTGTLDNVVVTADGTTVTIGSTTAKLAKGYKHGAAAADPGTIDNAIPAIGSAVVAELVDGSVQFLFGGGAVLAAADNIGKVTGISFNSASHSYMITFDYQGTTLTMPITQTAVNAGVSTGYAYLAAASDTITDVKPMTQDPDVYKVTALTSNNGSVTAWTLTNETVGTTTISNGASVKVAVYDASGNFLGDEGALVFDGEYNVFHVKVSTVDYYVFQKK